MRRRNARDACRLVDADRLRRTGRYAEARTLTSRAVGVLTVQAGTEPATIRLSALARLRSGQL